MSRKGFKIKKCTEVDRISELPDEIIMHILSLLALEKTVATSILSTRWSDLWKHTPTLVFIRRDTNGPMINIPIAMPIEEQTDLFLVRCLKNSAWVNSVIDSHEALSIRQFTISFPMHPKTYHHVSKWLHFAFSRQVESLKLDFVFSFFVLDINTFSGIQIGDYRFLKELALENFHMSGEVIEFLLRNCSLLERFIMKGILTSDLVISTTLLKHLSIFPCGRTKATIKVFAPNLTWLCCKYDCELLFLENVPNLVEASVWFTVIPCTMHHLLLYNAANVESLTITLCSPKVFSVPQMFKLKKSVLDYHNVNELYRLPVTCLLQGSPYLEEFTFEISDLHMYFFNNRIDKAILEVPKNGRFRYVHYCLKVFKFVGFCDKAPDHFELVKYIVNNCVALEEIIITPICTPVARRFIHRIGMSQQLIGPVDAIAEERHALAMKKSTEQLFAGKIPHRIKFIVK